MALNLRRAIWRRAVTTSVVVFVVGLLITFFSGSFKLALNDLAWPIGMSLGIGVFAAFEMMWKMKKGALNGIPSRMTMAKIDRADYPDANWQSIDDYGVQLQSRGYTCLGDFTVLPTPPQFKGVATCFLDSASSTIVEVQHVIGAARLDLQPSDTTQVHFSICSILAGHVAVMTTARTPNGVNYLLANNGLVTGACLPGLGLMDLLEKHSRRLANILQTTGQTVSNDLTMPRYVLLQRERFDATRERIRAMSGYQMAGEIDMFEADPTFDMTLPDATLRALAPRLLATLEQQPDAIAYPPIVDTQTTSVASGGTGTSDARIAQAATQTAEMQSLRPKIDGGASWFYWIAGLSLVNAISAALGSNWSFIIGLGFSQVLSGLGGPGFDGQEVPVMLRVIAWGLNLALITGFAYIGWRARQPSTLLFVIGLIIFGLDTLLFVYAQDWVGIGFHALALFFIWQGFIAARRYNALI